MGLYFSAFFLRHFFLLFFFVTQKPEGACDLYQLFRCDSFASPRLRCLGCSWRATLLLHLGFPDETCSIFAPKSHHVAELGVDLR